MSNLRQGLILAIEIAVNVALYILNPFAGLAASTAMALTAVVNVVVASLSSLLLAPHAPKRTESVRQAIASHKLIDGQMKVGGAITFIDTTKGDNLIDPYTPDQTPGNSILHLIVTIAGHPITAVDALYLNDIYVPLNANGFAQTPLVNPDGKKPTRFYHLLTMNAGLGTNAGDATLLSTISASSLKWLSNYKQGGRAKIYLRLAWNTNVYGSLGIPNISVIVRGRRLFDPRVTGATITGATAASPGVFTTSGAHGFVAGDMVWITNCAGAVPVAATSWPSIQRLKVAQAYEVNTVPSGTTFTLVGPDSLPLGLSHAGTGGTATKMTWSDNSALAANDYLCDPIHGVAVDYENEVSSTLVISEANHCDETVTRAQPTTTFTASAGTDLVTWAINPQMGVVPMFAQLLLTTTGTLPAGLATNTIYFYAQSSGSNSGYLCSSYVNANANPPTHIDITDAGTGTHSLQIVERIYDVDQPNDILTLYSNSQRLTTGTAIVFATNGTCPAGITAGTTYYAIFFGDVQIRVATSLANARAGTYIDITGGGTGTTWVTAASESRFTCNGVIDTTETRQQILQKLLSSMAGMAVPVGNSIAIYSGVYRTPNVTLTETDLRGPIQVSSLMSGATSFNSIKGTFIDPFNKGQATDYPQLQNTTYIAADQGEIVWKDLTLEFTNSSTMAQRLAKIDMERTRRELSVTMACKLTAFQIGATDTISINNTMWGWVGQTFEVQSWQFAISPGQNSDAPMLGIDITGRQTDSGVFAWTSAEEAAAKKQLSTNFPNPFVVAPPTNLAIASGNSNLYIRPDGTVQIRAHLTWTAPDDQFVKDGGFIEIAYTVHGSGTWVSVSPPLPGDAVEAYVLDVQVGTVYDFAIRARNAIGSVSDTTHPWQAEVASVTITGKTSVPSDITTLTVSQSGIYLQLVGSPITDTDVAEFEYRYGASASWGAMTLLGTATARPTAGGFSGILTCPIIAQGSYYFGVKAKDTSGNYSTNAAYSSLIAVVGAAPATQLQDGAASLYSKVSGTLTPYTATTPQLVAFFTVTLDGTAAPIQLHAIIRFINDAHARNIYISIQPHATTVSWLGHTGPGAGTYQGTKFLLANNEDLYCPVSLIDIPDVGTTLLRYDLYVTQDNAAGSMALDLSFGGNQNIR